MMSIVEAAVADETPRTGTGSGLIFQVSAANRLLAAMMASFLRASYPAGRIEVTELGPDLAPSRWAIEVRLGEDCAGGWFAVTRDEDTDGIADALLAGASAVLSLGSDPADLRRALEALVAGGFIHIPSHLLGQLMGVRPGREQSGVALTGREREVLRLVAQGCSNREIAAKLCISPHTVRSHLQALARKLQASKRTKLLANARALNIPEAFETAS